MKNIMIRSNPTQFLQYYTTHIAFKLIEVLSMSIYNRRSPTSFW